MRATPVNMQACEAAGIRGAMSYCPQCGAQYSATSGDYWHSDPRKPLYCHGKAMRLVVRYAQYQEITEDWFPANARV